MLLEVIGVVLGHVPCPWVCLFLVDLMAVSERCSCVLGGIRKPKFIPRHCPRLLTSLKVSQIPFPISTNRIVSLVSQKSSPRSLYFPWHVSPWHFVANWRWGCSSLFQQESQTTTFCSHPVMLYICLPPFSIPEENLFNFPPFCFFFFFVSRFLDRVVPKHLTFPAERQWNQGSNPQSWRKYSQSKALSCWFPEGSLWAFLGLPYFDNLLCNLTTVVLSFAWISHVFGSSYFLLNVASFPKSKTIVLSLNWVCVKIGDPFKVCFCFWVTQYQWLWS